MTPTVGIFSRAGDTEYAWLTGRLGEYYNVLPIYISNNNRRVLIQSLSQCQFAILYHSKNRGRINITDVTDSIYDYEISLLSDRLGPNKVLAVIDDLEDSSEETKNKILSSQPTLQEKTGGNVFLFTKEEKQNKQRLREKVQPIIDLIQRGTFTAPNPIDEPEGIPEYEQENCVFFLEDPIMTPKVGIFSRSGDTEYAWLTGRLGKYYNVLPIYISNNNRRVLIQSLSQCQFAILYHSKNRGRINITDVNDSLYDYEISLLSDRLGPSKVLAVIDDLEDSSEETKNKILSSQPTLREKTGRNVFLFTKEEKRNKQRLREKVQPIIDLIQRGTFTAPKHIDEPEDRPKPKQEKEKSRDTVPFLVVLALSGIMCQEMYRSPDGRNWFLASFWTVGAFRAYFKKPSQLFWFHPRIHSMFSWMETLVSVHNFYYRRSISNAVLPAFWLPASLGLLHNNRRQSHLNQSVLKMMGYGLVLYTFWRGWEIRDTTDVSELLVQIVLCSPYTLVAL